MNPHRITLSDIPVITPENLEFIGELIRKFSFQIKLGRKSYCSFNGIVKSTPHSIVKLTDTRHVVLFSKIVLGKGTSGKVIVGRFLDKGLDQCWKLDSNIVAVKKISFFGDGCGVCDEVQRECEVLCGFYPEYAGKVYSKIRKFLTKQILVDEWKWVEREVAGKIISSWGCYKKPVLINRKAYITMPYFSGVNFHYCFVFSSPPISSPLLGQRFVIARKTALELGRLHNLGYVHRDIRPANFMFDPNADEVRLIDFARAVKCYGRSASLGMDQYVAPELSGDLLSIKPSSDVYSLGKLFEDLFKEDRYGNAGIRLFLDKMVCQKSEERLSLPTVISILGFMIEVWETDPNIRDKQQFTKLDKAICEDRAELAALLIFCDSCFLLLPATFNTALLYAAMKNNDEIFNVILRLVGEHARARSISLDLNIENSVDCGNQPLHYAVRHGNIKMVESLLDEGANPNKQNKDGDTPFVLAVRGERVDLIDLMVDKGALLSCLANEESCQLIDITLTKAMAESEAQIKQWIGIAINAVNNGWEQLDRSQKKLIKLQFKAALIHLVKNTNDQAGLIELFNHFTNNPQFKFLHELIGRFSVSRYRGVTDGRQGSRTYADIRVVIQEELKEKAEPCVEVDAILSIGKYMPFFGGFRIHHSRRPRSIAGSGITAQVGQG
jgi:serine/threonine protein kinase